MYVEKHATSKVASTTYRSLNNRLVGFFTACSKSRIRT